MHWLALQIARVFAFARNNWLMSLHASLTSPASAWVQLEQCPPPPAVLLSFSLPACAQTLAASN